MNSEKEIFKRGSTTYYFSSIFFPKKVRNDVFALYSFVRTADDFVDKIPPRADKLLHLEKLYKAAAANPYFSIEHNQDDDISERVIKNIMYLSKKYNFKTEWIIAFFDSMKQDVHPRNYQTIDASLQYVYGSADVIGLMMAKILNLPNAALESAKKQGTAMQWINFIRDINEDNTLGRLYFPKEDLKKFDLADLNKKNIHKNQLNFERFIRFELGRYYGWQQNANKGIGLIPYRLRIALITANGMYAWTAKQIERNPMVVYEKQVKPSKYHVMAMGVWSILRAAIK